MGPLNVIRYVVLATSRVPFADRRPPRRAIGAPALSRVVMWLTAVRNVLRPRGPNRHLSVRILQLSMVKLASDATNMTG